MLLLVFDAICSSASYGSGWTGESSEFASLFCLRQGCPVGVFFWNCRNLGGYLDIPGPNKVRRRAHRSQCGKSLCIYIYNYMYILYNYIQYIIYIYNYIFWNYILHRTPIPPDRSNMEQLNQVHLHGEKICSALPCHRFVNLCELQMS